MRSRRPTVLNDWPLQGSSVYCTPVAANGVLYIANRNQLIALAEGKGKTAMLDLRSLFARK